MKPQEACKFYYERFTASENISPSATDRNENGNAGETTVKFSSPNLVFKYSGV